MSGPQQHAQTVLSAALAIVEAVRRDGDPAFAHLLQAFDKASHQPAATPADSRANEIAAWMTEDGERVVSASTMGRARQDGGATLSGLKPYSVPLVRAAAAPAVQVHDSTIAKDLVDVVLGIASAWPAVSDLGERSTQKLCEELEAAINAALKGQK